MATDQQTNNKVLLTIQYDITLIYMKDSTGQKDVIVKVFIFGLLGFIEPMVFPV